MKRCLTGTDWYGLWAAKHQNSVGYIWNKVVRFCFYGSDSNANQRRVFRKKPPPDWKHKTPTSVRFSSVHQCVSSLAPARSMLCGVATALTHGGRRRTPGGMTVSPNIGKALKFGKRSNSDTRDRRRIRDLLGNFSPLLILRSFRRHHSIYYAFAPWAIAVGTNAGSLGVAESRCPQLV